MSEQSGFILISVLLFVFILTSLVTMGLESCWLDAQLAAEQQQRTMVIQTAESAIVALQNQLQDKSFTLPPTKASLFYSSRFEKKDKFGNMIYWLTATSQYYRIHVTLECEYLVDSHHLGKLLWWGEY